MKNIEPIIHATITEMDVATHYAISKPISDKMLKESMLISDLLYRPIFYIISVYLDWEVGRAVTVSREDERNE